MDLHSGAPYWLLRNALGTPDPPLGTHERCDVLVIGAGITGALVADALSADGCNVVVIDRRDAGAGSTAASTALLLYETDAELQDLVHSVGERNAVRAWELGREAIEQLVALAAEFDGGCDAAWADALYLASRRGDRSRLREELRLRRRLGFDVEYLDGKELKRGYGIRAHGALRSPGAGRIDPLALTRQLLQRARGRGARIYGNTAAEKYALTDRGAVLRLAGGTTISADWLVFATGYEVPELVPRDLVRLHSTFALVTEREGVGPDPLAGLVIWESARPYCYLRSTPDGRVMIGGCDAPFKNAALRDRILPGRVASLEKRQRGILPDVERGTAFAWCGTFAETKDSLPFIGPVPGEDAPRALMALGYGGNGITFSKIAAGIIADLCQGRRNEDAELFAVGGRRV